MSITDRKQRQKEEVRGSILTAAWQLALDEGWQSLSIRKIADAIEYSAPVIYDHFENKEAILLEFTKKGFGELAQKLQKAKSKHHDPAKQLEAMAQAYWDFAFANREYYQLMYGLGMPSCECQESTPEIQGFTNVIIDTFKEIFPGARNQKIVCFKYYTYWSILHGLISIYISEKDMSSNGISQLVLKDAIAGFIKGLKE